MVKGDAKGMSSDYLAGAKFDGYGSTLYVGLKLIITD